MAHGVVRGVAAVLECLVGHVHRVAAAFLDLRGPDGPGVGALPAAFRHSGTAGGEGVVGEGVDALEVGEPFSRVLPAAFFGISAAAAHGALAPVAEGGVVVGDDLPPLGVALPRGDEVGAGVLEHRHQEGQHERRGEHVFDRAVQAGPLPQPAAGGLVVVFSVALPDCEVAAVESEREAAGPDSTDQASVLLPGVGYAASVARGAAVVALGGEYQLGELVAVGVDVAQGVAVDDAPGERLQSGAEPVDVVFVPGIVGEFCREVEVEAGAADPGPRHAEVLLVNPHALEKQSAQRVAHLLEVPGLGRRRDGCRRQQEQQSRGCLA